MPLRGVLFVLTCALATGCAPERQPGPFELTEEKVWKVVNRNHRGGDGIYLQAAFHTFAYEIVKAYATAEEQDLDQGQLESRLKELIYRHAISDYPAQDGTDINSLYIQYLIYVNPSFDPANPLQKKVFDNWTAQYVRQVLDKVYDRNFPMLRNYYDERWGTTLYSRLIFFVYLDNTDSYLQPRIDDIGEHTFLVDDLGNRYSSSGMAGPYPYESNRPRETHLKDKLVYPVFFPNRQADHKTPIITPQSRYIQLEIEGLGGEKVRNLRWNLPLQYPEMPSRRLPSAAEKAALSSER